MTGLRIADDLHLPDEAVTETFAILAKRGKGKTYTAAVLAEELIGAGFPTVVIDPIGVWWGLRASADGQGAGLPVVIFGGDHGDVPLQDTAGELIADVLVDQRIPAVLDLSLFSKAAARRFMAAFVERLYHRNRDALHVIVDEADAFAPQRTTGDGARLLGAMEDLVRRGRARGIGVTLITQRPAVLNKDVLTQAEVLIALGMTGPRDVAAIDEWVRLHADEDQAREVKASLPALPVGTAWVWSPGWLGLLQRVEIRRRTTFDSSATPKPGQRRVVPKRMADVDLAALGEKIAATAEQARADDPRALRRWIAELERQLADAKAEVVEVPALSPEDRGSLVGAVIALQEITKRLDAVMAKVEPHGPTGAVLARVETDPVRAERDRMVEQYRHGQQKVPPPRPTHESVDGPIRLRAGARRMVETLGRMWPLRLTTGQWGMVAKLKTTGGTWSTYLGEIRRAGLVEQTDAGWQLTDAGFDYLGGRPSPMTAGELQDHYRSILRAGAVKMLDALVEVYPDGLSKDNLGERAGIVTTGGTFSTYLGELVRNGLAERTELYGIRATDILMRGAEA